MLPISEYFTSFLGRQFHDIGVAERNATSGAGNTLEGDVSDVIALDQLTSPFSSRKATKMSP